MRGPFSNSPFLRLSYFVAQAPLEGKRRDFIPLYGNTNFQAMPHCAFKLCARQSKCLCIASEISAKLFDFLCAMYFSALPALLR
jgi:hypothetical protein